MLILAIDTSCDETAASVTSSTEIVSSVIWSQAAMHAKFGGVMPSLAQRQHLERIDFVVNRAMLNAKCQMINIDAIAITVGPGLGIALGVGINKAKELAIKYNKPLIPVNHVEAHLLSSLAMPKTENLKLKIKNLKFPMLGLVLSGGTTILCLVKAIDQYEILAETSDDALGEALDKSARLLGLGYPGGAILEKFARDGDPKKYKLPLPLQNDRIKNRFSYSGLKTAFVRLFNSVKNPRKQDIADLAASFQSVAFDHVEKVVDFQITNSKLQITNLLAGGGVINNIELKKRLRKLAKKYNMQVAVPYTKKLNGDNAAMIGVCAYLKNKNLNAKKINDKQSLAKLLFSKYGGLKNINSIDRNPKLKI